MSSQLTEIIKNADNIVFFGGAGVSTESGIPDFRSEKGLYSAKTEYGKSPEELIHHDFFMRDPKTFYDYYKKNLIYSNAQPNKAHSALAWLESPEGGAKLKAVITQNIDGLHQLAGSKNVLELHGSVLRNTCMDCGKKYPLEYILDADGVPYCSCGGIIKPDVTLYGEMLPDGVFEAATVAVRGADVLIVGGTSLAVYPAAGLLQYFSGDKLVLINKSRTQYDSQTDLVIHDSIGDVLYKTVTELKNT